ncbi:MAG: ATP-binding protein [Bacteroidales bacterium]
MADDYKNEYLPQLQKSIIYAELKQKCSDKGTEVIALVDSAVEYAIQRTKTVIKHMGEFTLHDNSHLFRVLYLMEKILPENTIKNLSSPELMLLILSSFFHDIGMAPCEKQVQTWKKIWDNDPQVEIDEQADYDEFKRFYLVHPEQQDIILQLVSTGNHSQADTIKSYLITEFIRKSHSDRAKDIIEKDWNGKIKYRDSDLTSEFAAICFSHNENAYSALEFDKNYLCAENTYVCLPLIAVCLRVADILDFDAKRTPSILFSHLYVREPLSIKEWNKHRSVEAWEISPDIIQFSAKCTHPAIEASIHQFCDIIDSELSICNNIISSVNEYNGTKRQGVFLKFPYKVNREKISTKKDIKGKPLYIYRDTKFNLSKRQVIDLLMGTKLYGDPEVALRELLQNSIDACLLRQAQEKKWGTPYNPEIFVKYYSDNGAMILEVEDNGTGMDQHIIDNYYSKVGTSFYKSTDFYTLKSESRADFTPTSRFGIGILSCFMVADTMIVDTKKLYAQHKSSDPLNITIEGQDSIFLIKEGTREQPGTTTKLILRKSNNPWGVMTAKEFVQSVETLIQNPPFKINIETGTLKKVRDENSFKEPDLSSMIDYTWEENSENIRTFDIALNNDEYGISGIVKIAVVETHGHPTNEIKVSAVDVNVEGESYTLDKKISVSDNSIKKKSKTISVDEDGNVQVDDLESIIAKSKSKISLHGINVPTSVFPGSWQKKNNQAALSFPFPMLLMVDICGKRDLDLNSSRTEILISEKWFEFEETLAYLICSEVKNQVTDDYWGKMKELLLKSKNENFLKGLNRV